MLGFTKERKKEKNPPEVELRVQRKKSLASTADQSEPSRFPIAYPNLPQLLDQQRTLQPNPLAHKQKGPDEQTKRRITQEEGFSSSD